MWCVCAPLDAPYDCTASARGSSCRVRQAKRRRTTSVQRLYPDVGKCVESLHGCGASALRLTHPTTAPHPPEVVVVGCVKRSADAPHPCKDCIPMSASALSRCTDVVRLRSA